MKQHEYNDLLDTRYKLEALIESIQLSPNGVLVTDQDLDYITPAYKLLNKLLDDNYPPEKD